MYSAASQLPEIKIVGITCRTNNVAESNAHLAQIGLTMGKFFTENLPDQISYRKNPGITYCVYTNYESDFNGDYTYFIGEEVTAFDDSNIAKRFSQLVIPTSNYTKFTNIPGEMPKVCIDMWHRIWEMDAKELGGSEHI
jgi:hypothetical protein